MRRVKEECTPPLDIFLFASISYTNKVFLHPFHSLSHGQSKLCISVHRNRMYNASISIALNCVYGAEVANWLINNRHGISGIIGIIDSLHHSVAYRYESSPHLHVSCSSDTQEMCLFTSPKSFESGGCESTAHICNKIKLISQSTRW